LADLPSAVYSALHAHLCSVRGDSSKIPSPGSLLYPAALLFASAIESFGLNGDAALTKLRLRRERRSHGTSAVKKRIRPTQGCVFTRRVANLEKGICMNCSLFAAALTALDVDAEPVAAEARPTLLICCLASGECSEADPETCDARQVAEEVALHPPPPVDIFADTDPERLSERWVLEREDMIEAIVDRCDAPSLRPEIMRGYFMHCILRLGMDGLGERVELTWPWYSHRWEAGHPNFQDPIIGQAFWITFDDRYRENLVFHARPMGKRAASGEVMK
jgi:hypothetical protein